MRVREAQDRVVLVAIAAGPRVALPEIALLGVRAELDHAEGQGGAREGVAVAAGADEDVDLGGMARGRRIGGRGDAGAQARQQRGGEREEGWMSHGSPVL